MILLIVHRII